MDDDVDDVSVFTVHVDCCRFGGVLEDMILVDVFSIPLPLMVTVSCVVESCSKSRLFAAAATARRSRLSAASCSRSSSSASLRYKSLNSSKVISERADFLDAAESPERMPLIIPFPPKTAALPFIGLSSSCDLEVPVGRSMDISPVLPSLEEGSRYAYCRPRYQKDKL